MNRKEIKNGLRLACQVRVKNDIEIYMPDFLETVKEIVKNRLYSLLLKKARGVSPVKFLKSCIKCDWS